MAKKREKKVLEENYIQAKIASCKKLILDSSFDTQRAIYQGYLDYWVSKAENSIILPDKVFEKVVERLEMPFESQKTIEEKITENKKDFSVKSPVDKWYHHEVEFDSKDNVTATTEVPLESFSKAMEKGIDQAKKTIPEPTILITPGVLKKSITEVIEESQVETLEGIKEVLDDHKDVINGNKVRCPQCNEMFTKGAGFSAHYRAKHLE